MPPAKVVPETPNEIEDVDQWNAIVSKDNLDLNVVDVYAEWCGPCMCKCFSSLPSAAAALAFSPRGLSSVAARPAVAAPRRR